MTEQQPVIVAGWIAWEPADRAVALAHFEQVAKASREEPDCIAYYATADGEDPGRVRVFEHWTSEAALREHLTLPHVAQFRAAVSGLTRTGRDMSLHVLQSSGPDDHLTAPRGATERTGVTTTPHYIAGIDFDPTVRKDAYGVMARLVEHFKATSTDTIEQKWHEPVANYRDPELWQREISAVHKRAPLPLALSCELPEPGTYKAIDAAGTPVLITRDRSGQARAMLNICRHRGAELLPAGLGTARRVTCPYHAWSYDLAGCLLAVYGEQTYGEVDKGAMSLVQLPVAERAGLIFVSLDPKATIDLDEWLGADLITLLEALALDRCYHHSTRWLDGPNWKVVVDGYLEGYHFASLHKDTVFRTNLSNMAAFDSWGPHQRNSFALRPIAEAVGRPEDEWDPATCVGAIFWLFPGLAIAGGWRQQVAVSLVLPGTTWDSSRTEQHILLRHEPADDVERHAADHTRDWFHDVVLDEDYGAGFGVQRGLEAMTGQDFVFGRNEPGVQHFHRAVGEQLAAAEMTP